MFPFHISSSSFEPEISIPENSPTAEFDSDLSMSKKPSFANNTAVSSTACFFDLSTCKRQSFSIPEKILYYIAKNVTNAKTFQKLIETCKYFFKINPVIVVFQIKCYDNEWYAYYDWKYRVGFKYDQPIDFKIWVTYEFSNISGDAPQLIPSIYKNDATVVDLRCEPLKFEEFLFLAGNAIHLSMYEQMVKYESGETVQLEDIIKSVPKITSLTFKPCFDGSEINCNTVRKLMEIEHFKNISQMKLYNVSEALDVKEMFHYICENKQIEVDLYYRRDVSDAYKELVREYSNRLKNEKGCYSIIKYDRMNFVTVHEISYSEDDSFDDNTVSDDDENEDLPFSWKNVEDEEWELPWDKE